MATIKGIKVGTTTITASYTEGGVTKTASQSLTVTALSFTVNALSNVVFTGNAQKLEPVVKGYNVDGQNVTLTKGTDYTVAWSSNTDSTTCKAVGTITVTVTGAGNYTGTKTTTYQITNATLTVSADNQSNVYTGSQQGNAISATSVGSQAVTIKYGTTSGTYNLSSAPQITHVSESKTIYYQVTAPNHATKTGQYALDITPKEVGLSWSSTTSWVYDGSVHSTSCSATGVVSGDTCIVTLSNNSVGKNVGTKTVTATGLSNGDYKLPTTGLTKSISITQKEVTLNWGTTSWTYDGVAHSTTCTAGSLVGSDTCNVTLSNNSVGKNVDTQTVTASSLDNSNYKLPSAKTKTISITQKEVTLTWGTTSWTYDGSAHSTTCTAGSLVSGDSCTVTLSGNSITNKGTATVTATELDNGNYKLPTTGLTKSISITQKEVTLNWGTTSWTYDGSAHSTTCTAGSLVGSDTCNVTLTNNSVGKNVGNQTVTASSLDNSNYKLPSAKTKTISITQKEVTLTWGTTSWTYDGSAHSTTCTVGSLVGSDTCTVTLSGNSITNAGTATVTATELDNGNYKLPTSGLSKTLTVEQRKVTFTAVNQTKTYDGALLNADNSIELTSGTLASNQTATGSCTGSIGANVTTGTKTLSSVTIKDSSGTNVTSNYTITNNNGSLSITQRTVSLNWGSTSTWVYDGTEHTMTCMAGNVVSGDSCTVTLKNNKLTNVGDSTAEATGLSNTNYILPSSKTKAISVTARPIKITADSASREYNGSALTKDTATAEAKNGSRGLASGEHLHSWTCTGSQTYVDESSNVVSGATIYKGTHNGTESATTSNYDIEYVPGTLTITKATPSVTVANVNITFTGNDATTTANVNAKGTLYWKKNSSATASSYDGSVNISSVSTNTSFTITGVNENNEDCTLYWLFVPSSSATITTGQTYAANFGNNNGTATITINPRSISSISASAATVIYNGSSQTASLTISDSGATLTANDYTITGNTQTNAGTHTITFTGKNNYTGTKTISWKINPKAITVTAGSDSKIFDNTALTCDTATSTTLGTGDHLHSWTCTGSQTNCGSSNNVASDAKIYKGTHTGSESDVTDNYTITYEPGTLTVNQREVTLNWGDVTWTYDGYTHSTTCTAGNVVSGTDCTVTLDGNSVGANVGNATVTAESLSNDNYKLPSVKTKTLTISSRAVTYTAIDQTKVYDKSKLTAANTANLTSGSLAANQTAIITCTGEIGPDVSEGVKKLSDVVIKQGSTNVTSNYTITKVNGTLEITKANGTITYTATNASRICTDAAAAKTNTDDVFALSVSTGATGATGTVSCAISVNSGGVSGWSVTSDGKTVTVPTGTAAGEYNVKLTATSAANTNYKEASQARTITVTIIENKLVELTMSLNTPNGDNKIAFGSSTTPSAVAKYTNDQTKTVNATYTTSDSTIAEIS